MRFKPKGGHLDECRVSFNEVLCVLPLVEFAVDQVLGLVGAGFGGEGDELRHVLLGHTLDQFVGNGQSLSCTCRSYANHLQQKIQS